MSRPEGFAGPARGAPIGVLLAHGAGSDMHAPALCTVADALAAAGIASLRFDYPYRAAGRRPPDRAPVLIEATRGAALRLARAARLAPEQVVLAGRSMGGRMASLLAGGVDPAGTPLADGPWPAPGLVLLGYPLHPPGRPEALRTGHFPKLRMPVLFVSGTRDAFGSPDELKAAARSLRGRRRWHWIDTADHGFAPRRSSGITAAEALAGAADAVCAFVTSLVAYPRLP